MYDIDLQSRVPIYEQLYKKITELILKGELKENDKLPSVRELAKELGVNPNTISKAFQTLEHDKIIYSLAGRGSFVAAQNPALLREEHLKKMESCLQNAVDAARLGGISCEEACETLRLLWEG